VGSNSKLIMFPAKSVWVRCRYCLAFRDNVWCKVVAGTKCPVIVRRAGRGHPALCPRYPMPPSNSKLCFVFLQWLFCSLCCPFTNILINTKAGINRVYPVIWQLKNSVRIMIKVSQPITWLIGLYVHGAVNKRRSPHEYYNNVIGKL
jgi:hypothetical protein